MVCKSCGWNATHTTGYRDKWVADPKSISFPAPHLFWSKSGKNPPEGGSGGSITPTAAPTTTAASITSDRSLSSRIGPLIAQYKTNTKDGQFASFLAEFERALNEGDIVSMTVVAMFSLFSFQSSSSTACKTSFGVQAFLVGSLAFRMTGSLLDGGVFGSLALITEEPLVGVDVRSLMV